MDPLKPPSRSPRDHVDESGRYATFWQRFAAGMLDMLVFLPLAVIQWLVDPAWKQGAFALSVVSTCLGLSYHIYAHGRFGQTIGKWAMGIRVMRAHGGGRIGWRQAGLRSSVDGGLAILGMIGQAVAVAAIADVAYYGVGWHERFGNMAALEPRWSIWAHRIAGVWYWSELITMLFNKRRRALHDFLAGTVVISVRKVETSASAAEPSADSAANTNPTVAS